MDSPWLAGPRAHAPSHGALVKGEGLVKCTKLDREKVLTTWMTQFLSETSLH